MEKEIPQRYIALIKHIAKQIAKKRKLYKLSGIDEADLFSAGCIGYLESVASYDPTKGVFLVTWAYPHIRGKILDFLRLVSYSKRNKKIYMEFWEPSGIEIVNISDSDREEVVGEDKLISRYDNDKLLEGVKNAIKSLDSQSQYLIKGHFFEEKSLAEVGAEIGLNKWAALKRLNKAVRRIKNVYDGMIRADLRRKARNASNRRTTEELNDLIKQLKK